MGSFLHVRNLYLLFLYIGLMDNTLSSFQDFCKTGPWSTLKSACIHLHQQT